MIDQGPSATTVREAVDNLRKAGVATVTVSFSGGNDEGGADSIEYLDAAGALIGSIPKADAYESSEWDANTRTYGPPTWHVYEGYNNKRPATAEEIKWAKVAQVLESPIYERFGSFAGDFYVQGNVTWDIDKGTYEMHGEEEVHSWESF